MEKFKFAVPTAVALVAIAFMIRATGFEPAPGEKGHVVETAPTPYSNSHAIVQGRPGGEQEQPPTF